MFDTPEDACNFILKWDGRSTQDLLAAITLSRSNGDRFQHDVVLRKVARMPFEFPRPKDIPIFLGSPIWVIDANGHALIGMPGSERIEHIDELRRRMEAKEVESGLFRNDTFLL